MSILVTGGAGFMGSNFIRHWLQEEDSLIVNIDKITYAGKIENLPLGNPRHIFVKGDIGDYSMVVNLLAQYRPRSIVNFAAESHVDRAITEPTAFIKTNIMGTFQLLNASLSYWKDRGCWDGFRFIHISTDEVYGSLDPWEEPFKEDHPYRPSNVYSASKASSDHLVRAYFKTHRLPAIVTHSSNNYGPYQFPEKLIPLTIHQALRGESIPIYGNGQQIREWLYVEDHCRAICKVLAQGRVGEVYNIGGANQITNLAMVQAIWNILDQKGFCPPKEILPRGSDFC